MKTVGGNELLSSALLLARPRKSLNHIPYLSRRQRHDVKKLERKQHKTAPETVWTVSIFQHPSKVKNKTCFKDVDKYLPKHLYLFDPYISNFKCMKYL